MNSLGIQQVTDLLSVLGHTLLGSMTQTSTAQVIAWLEGEATPTEAEQERLAFAHDILSDIIKSEGPDVARSWFIGANVYIGNDEVSPVTGIRLNHFAEVKASARRLINSEWS